MYKCAEYFSYANIYLYKMMKRESVFKFHYFSRVRESIIFA